MKITVVPSIIVLQIISQCLTVHGSRSGSGENKIRSSFIGSTKPNVIESNQHLTSSLPPSPLHDTQLGTFTRAATSFISNKRQVSPFSTNMRLFVKKSKKNAGAVKSKTNKKTSSPPLKNGKIQVKLLKHVPGTGNIGEVILVAPAFYQNKLLKTNSAKVITDEEVKAEKLKRDADQRECRDAAKEMASLLEKEDESTLTFLKKAGPNGQLFGGIRAKDVLQTLKSKYPKGNALEGKNVKVVSIKDMDGNDVDHGDIKSLGEFKVKISILSGVDAEITVSVQAE